MGGAGGAVLTLKLQDLFLFSLLFPTVFHPVWFFSSLFVFKRQYNSRFFRQKQKLPTCLTVMVAVVVASVVKTEECPGEI